MALTEEGGGPEIIAEAPSGKDQRFRLTSLALGVITISILAIVVLLFVKSFEATDTLKRIPQLTINDSINKHQNDSLFQLRFEVIKAIREEKKEYRDFFLKICQMILLNLLLPILTAILGYKVGSKSNED